MTWASIVRVLTAIKEYWFLVTLFVSAGISIVYMIVFRVNPWDAQRSAKLRSGQVRFHNSVAHSLLDEGRFSAAKIEFDEALKLVPVDQTALNGRYLADLFLTFNSPDWDPAVGLAIQRHLDTEAVEQERIAHVVQKYLGDLNDRIANFAARNNYYKEALRRKPDYPDALFAVGWNYYTDDNDPDGMEKAFRQMAAINPYDYRGLHGLGYALYMKAIREDDRQRREALIAEATSQSQMAKNLSINQVHIVMDFGEVARSGSPDVSLYFHQLGKKIIEDPALSKIGDNPYGLSAKLLMLGSLHFLETKEQKLAWIGYQMALDHLAMHRKQIEADGQTQHDELLEKARRRDPDGIVYPIYQDQLTILDRLLPEKKT